MPVIAQRFAQQWLGLGIFGLGIWSGITGPSSGMAREISVYTCPQALETLTAMMLTALPSYTNRVIQRSKRSPAEMNGYVLVAGRAEFDPLPLRSLQYKPVFPNTSHQVFFTTLERHYNAQKSYQLQNYYWAFFVLTERGWQLSQLYSQLASLRKDDPPLPATEAREGAIGQAIQLWLRDCHAGVIPPSPQPSDSKNNLEQTKNQ